jgi:hypothetical protein
MITLCCLCGGLALEVRTRHGCLPRSSKRKPLRQADPASKRLGSTYASSEEHLLQKDRFDLPMSSLMVPNF